MRTLRLLLFPVVFILAFALITPCAPAPLQASKEADHNKKGMEYYNEAFYKKLPSGKQREADGFFDLAVTEFKQAIAANPRYTDAHRNLARVCYVRKDFLQAAEAFKTVTVLEPRDIDAYIQLALSYTELDRFAEAVQALENAKTHTDNPEVTDKLDAYIGKLRDRK